MVHQLTFQTHPMKKQTIFNPSLQTQSFNADTAKAYKIQLILESDSTLFSIESSNSWNDQLKAEAVLASIQRNAKHASVKEIYSERNIETAPLLFDTASLLQTAQQELGFSKQLTDNLAKRLYLYGQITSPDTNSRHIDQEQWLQIPMLLQLLSDKDTYSVVIDRLKWERLNRSILSNTSKPSHGILPLDYPRPSLSAKEKALQQLIINQTLEALSQPCIREITSIHLLTNEYVFKLKTEKVLSIGWRAVKGHVFSNEALPEMPAIYENQQIKIKQAKLLVV